MRWALVFLSMVLLVGARAVRVEVVQADRLELRKVGDHELIVLYGQPVKIRLEDGQEIEATTVEYDRKARRLLLLGEVSYLDKENRIIKSKYIELYLDDESMDALEVHLQAGGIDLWGPEATRVLGQILMKKGCFTPCAHCGQQPYDYSFSAEKVVLYPGDRLIAYGTTIYIQGEPYLHWPVLMLNFSERRPRLEIRHDDTDGWSIAADLPYVTKNGLGFTLLRYFQNRGWGLGFDHWGGGVAYEHYRALYLPPEVAAERGSLELDLTYREGDKRLKTFPYYTNFHFQYKDAWPIPPRPHWSFNFDWRNKTDEWQRSLSLERRDLPSRNRLWLRVSTSQTSGPEPRASLKIKTYFDLGQEGPPAARTLPEATLKWTKGWSKGGFSIKGSVSAGGYFDRTNELNRSARAAGIWASAGRVYAEHSDIYSARKLWPGFSFYFENRFSGWYYSTGERQIDWRNTLSLEQKLGGLRLKTTLKRTVVEGEAFFARDYRRPQRTLKLNASVRWQIEKSLSLEVKGGRDIWQAKYQDLTTSLSWSPQPLSITLEHAYDLQNTSSKSVKAHFGFKLAGFSGSLSGGYDYTQSEYAPLLFKSSYALPGGNALLSHTYDLNQARSKISKFSISLQPGKNRYSLKESYDYDNHRLSGRLQAAWGPFSITFSHNTFLTPDPNDPNYHQSSLRFSASWRKHKLLLDEHWDGRAGRFGPGYLSLVSSYTGLRHTWKLNARWHLPEVDDGGFYLKNVKLAGGLDLITPTRSHPGLSLQGGLEYHRHGPQEREYNFKNFGFTFVWLADEHTRLFISTLIDQKIRTGQETPPLKPRFIFTFDRCCWAFQFTIDAATPAAKLAFMYGGQSARFLLDESGFHYPWEDVLQ